MNPGRQRPTRDPAAFVKADISLLSRVGVSVSNLSCEIFVKPLRALTSRSLVVRSLVSRAGARRAAGSASKHTPLWDPVRDPPHPCRLQSRGPSRPAPPPLGGLSVRPLLCSSIHPPGFGVEGRNGSLSVSQANDPVRSGTAAEARRVRLMNFSFARVAGPQPFAGRP